MRKLSMVLALVFVINYAATSQAKAYDNNSTATIGLATLMFGSAAMSSAFNNAPSPLHVTNQNVKRSASIDKPKHPDRANSKPANYAEAQ